jgi:hypothetical protein
VRGLSELGLSYNPIAAPGLLFPYDTISLLSTLFPLPRSINRLLISERCRITLMMDYAGGSVEADHLCVLVHGVRLALLSVPELEMCRVRRRRTAS